MEKGEYVHSTYVSKYHTEIIEEKASIRELLGWELCPRAEARKLRLPGVVDKRCK